MNGDGWTDLALKGAYSPHAIFFEALGGSQAEANIEFEPYAYDLMAALDANGDGLSELVFASNTAFYLFEGR